MADLTGVWAKFHHAEAHLEAFDASFRDFLESEPYGVAIDFDSDASAYSLTWDVTRDPPLDLSLVNGDLWGNLRASLDYLAWQLVLAGSGAPTDRTAFPRVEKRQNWASAVGDRLRGIDPVWIAEIEKLQPYHRADPARHQLSLLDSINNIYKHRLLPPVVLTVAETRLIISGGLGREFRGENFFQRPVEQGAEFMRIAVGQGGPVDDLQVHMDRGTVFRISFSDGLGDSWDTEDVFAWVRDAIAVFEPAFTS